MTSQDLYFSLEDLGAFKIKIKNEINDFDLILNNAKRLPLNQKRNNYINVNSNVEMLSIGSSLKICINKYPSTNGIVIKYVRL